MEDAQSKEILTINSGSSSIKFSLYRMGPVEIPVLRGEMEGIGQAEGLFSGRDGEDVSCIRERLSLPDHKTAMRRLLDRLREEGLDRDLDAVGHRVVHGGIHHSRPEWVTPDLLAEVKKLTPFVPEHLPHELAAIDTIGRDYPELPQVACFDTMFHRTLPAVAQRYPLPAALLEKGILRYGFHGLSYEYILEALKDEAGGDAAEGRIVIAHLGHGASMAAVRQGRCLETTMGFTPAGGLVMSTRSGDLDPGLLLYLLEQEQMAPLELNELVNRRSGLLGVSGTSGDMKELLASEREDPAARDAVDLFCYQARKFLGGLVAVLGGLETLIFTGGIGENAAEVRRRICEGLGFVGLRLDPERNRRHAPIVSASGTPVTVRVIHTNEERMIARHTVHLLHQKKL